MALYSQEASLLHHKGRAMYHVMCAQTLKGEKRALNTREEDERRWVDEAIKFGEEGKRFIIYYQTFVCFINLDVYPFTT